MEAIIRKIKACLALAGSDNPHEAAAAMRQAKKLMAQHGIGEDLLGVSREALKIRYARPPIWFWQLGAVIGKAFGCSFFIGYKAASFVGPNGSTEIAGYCFEVVLRSLEASKTAFIKRTAYWCGAGEKKQRATSYCEGFVLGAQNAVDKFAADISSASKEAHKEFLAMGLGAASIGTRPGKKIKLTQSTLDGIAEGKNIALHAPVAQQAQQLEFLGGRP